MTEEEAKRNARAVAQSALRPSVQAAATIRAWRPIHGDLDILALVEELANQSQAAIAGEMDRAEAMLIDQAHTLDAIFNKLARHAATNLEEGYLAPGETYLRLSLKAQSQCRTTLETLAEIKNPRPVTFVKQANIAAGHQQVNNGTLPLAPTPRAENSGTSANELLGSASDGDRLDFGATGPASEGDPVMETLGPINRTADT